MNQPILIDTEELYLHPFRAQEMKRFESLSKDILSLFNQRQTVNFLPHKKLTHLDQAQALLQMALFNQYNGVSQWYFITKKSDHTTIGIIELITPTTARKHYELAQYPYFLEFCICAHHAGQGIMSSILPQLIKALHQMGIHEIGAVVHPTNLSAIKVLRKSGIDKLARFDAVSHLYHN